MNIKVIYKSRKSSKIIANAIAEELNVKATPLNKVKNLDNTDILFLGCGIYGGNVPPEVSKFVEDTDFSKVKKVVLFTTSASGTNQTDELVKALKNKNVNVEKEVFSALGTFLFKNRKHPDKTEIENAIKFANNIVKMGA